MGIGRGHVNRHPGVRRGTAYIRQERLSPGLVHIQTSQAPFKICDDWVPRRSEHLSRGLTGRRRQITLATPGQLQPCAFELSRNTLSRILRGEILFKTVLSRLWRYERYWQSICGNSGGLKACRRRNWRTALRSTVLTSAHWSEASTLPALTLWTGWHGFSVLRRQIFSDDRPRLAIKREAGVNQALERCKLVRSRRAPGAETRPAAEPESGSAKNRKAVSPEIGVSRAIAKRPARVSGALYFGVWLSRRSCATATK